MSELQDKLSRRAFTRAAALLSTSVAIPTRVSEIAIVPTTEIESQAQQPELKLPEASQTEAGLRYKTILGLYGTRFSEEQKIELQRISAVTQQGLDRVRAYTVANGDSPALYLKPLMERDKRFAATNAPAKNS